MLPAMTRWRWRRGARLGLTLLPLLVPAALVLALALAGHASSSRRRAVRQVVHLPHCMKGTRDSLGKPSATGHQQRRRATSQSGHAGRLRCLACRSSRSSSAVFGARCSVLVHDDGSCVVIDAGAGVADDVLALVEERGLRPAAVLATHGHVDHTWDAARLSEALDVPVVLHAADVYRLADPFGTLGLLGRPAVRRTTRPDRSPRRSPPPGVDPTRLRGTAAGRAVRCGRRRPLGRTRCSSWAACASSRGTRPGTRRASTLLPGRDRRRPAGVHGDVLFAGTIGRTDLPGGDGATMQRRCARSSRPCRPRRSSSPGTDRRATSPPSWRTTRTSRALRPRPSCRARARRPRRPTSCATRTQRHGPRTSPAGGRESCLLGHRSNMCSNRGMRWDGQAITADDGALPGLGRWPGWCAASRPRSSRA